MAMTAFAIKQIQFTVTVASVNILAAAKIGAHVIHSRLSLPCLEVELDAHFGFLYLPS